MRYQLNLLLALTLAQAGCSITPEAHWPGSGRKSNTGRNYLVGNVPAEFTLSNLGVRILYADSVGDSQAARDKAGDDIAKALVSQRGGRVGLAGLYTSNPGKVATFGGVVGRGMFSIYCNGYCKNLVLRMSSVGGRFVAASIRSGYSLPVIEIAEPTYYPVIVTFELDAESSDLSHYSEVTVTQWENKTWIHRRLK